MIGFDIGTTQSKVAYVDQAGKPSPILNARGEDTTPSAIYLSDSGEPLVGKDALEQSVIDPTHLLTNFKLDLGSTKNLLSNGQVVTPTDATSIVVARLKKNAEEQLGFVISECVATCPANFRDDAKQAQKEAFERNGIEVLRLMSEPTAAGFAYMHDRNFTSGNTLIYDFGGGTFDVSVIEVNGLQLTVLATEGVPKLGGNDIADCIRRIVIKDNEQQGHTLPTPETDPLFFLDLTQRIEQAKLSLASQKEVPIVASCNGQQIITKISQQAFHAAIQPLVDQSLDALDRAVDAANLKMKDITRLIMVGGTSRSPFIQEAVANRTGLVPHTDIDPANAIAFGAALACISELSRKGKTATLHGKAIPDPELFVRDVTAHDVGCCVVDTKDPKKRLFNSVIVPKNTPIPCCKNDTFCFLRPDQTSVRTEILQGEANAAREDCVLIGELFLDNLPPEKKLSPRCNVEYIFDANGMVTATLTDLISKKTTTTSVDYKKGITAAHKPKSA